MSEREEIIIDAQESLSPGQNLYDQPPFRDLIQTISTKFSVDPLYVGALITTTARRIPWEEIQQLHQPDKQHDQILSQAKEIIYTATSITTALEHKRGITGSNRIQRARKSDFDSILNELIFLPFGENGYALHDYPLWYEYINHVDFQTNHLYNTFGEPNQKRPTEYANSSYAQWLKDRSTDPTIQSVLEETFPDDLADLPATTGNSIRRRYRILKASELMR